VSIAINFFLSVIVVILSVALGHEFAKRRSAEERIFRNKDSLYSTFMEKIISIFQNKSKLDEKPAKELNEYMWKFKFALILYGSDEVYKQFLEFMEESKKRSSDPKVIVEKGAELFKKMREDVLGKKTQLTNLELLSGFVSDIGKYYKE
jgi:hypothetical protein